MVPKKKRKHRDLLCWAPLKMVERDSMLNQTYRLNSLTTWSPEALICLGTRNFFGKTRTSIEALRLQVIRREQRYIEERWVFAGGGREGGREGGGRWLWERAAGRMREKGTYEVQFGSKNPEIKGREEPGGRGNERTKSWAGVDPGEAWVARQGGCGDPARERQR
ncbi:hypothetical protein RUM43_007971 [Polyplax serrata]|uniref:Uncharacterized protein n=1 Tax=Polyplax serrata TaxID=468196 RepID=A0AAN8PN64_POLSC